MPRFALLDLKPPKVGGAEVLRRIRADGRLEGLVVAVMVSRNGEGHSGEERADLRVDGSVDDDTFLRAIRRIEASPTGLGTFAGRLIARTTASAPSSVKRGWADGGGR